MIYIILAALLPLALYIWLIFPARPAKSVRERFARRYYAHRGLYSADQRVPENSLPAFAAAAAAGYGVELDVQLTADKQVVVFHDDTLLRACGADARVDAFTYAELTETMRLFGTEERIPLFTEVLATYAGAGPMIVELKSGGDLYGLCERTLSLLRQYEGAFCIESFDPKIVRWFRRSAPDIVRGQLAQPMRKAQPYLGARMALLTSRLCFNFVTRPHFIAYRIAPLPWTVRMCGALGAMLVAWTARPANAAGAALESTYDAVIFEHYTPGERYASEN